MFRLGDNGIVLVGNAKLIDGSTGDQPRGTQILYNIITENGIWGKQVCNKSNMWFLHTCYAFMLLCLSLLNMHYTFQ